MINRNTTRLFIKRRFRLGLKLAAYLLTVMIAAAALSFKETRATGFAPMETATISRLTVVSAASYSADAFSPDSIASAFGDNLSTSTVAATDVDPNLPGVQLPTTLGGTRVLVGGVPAPLLFVSKQQVNFIIPSEIPPATRYGRGVILEVLSGGLVVASDVIGVYKTAPAMFTHDSSGRGFPAATLVRVKANGEQVFQSFLERDEGTGLSSMRPIDLSDETERVFISLFLSGIRHAADPNNDGNLNETVRVEINGFEFIPSYAGRQPDFIGVDQINFELPRQLTGNPALTLRVISTDTGLTYNPGLLNYTNSGGIVSNPTEIYLKPPVIGRADWRQSGLNSLDVHALLITGLVTFAATSGGIYNSLDDGESWSKATHTMPPIIKDIPGMYSLLRIPRFLDYSYMAGSNGATYVSGYIPYESAPIVPGKGVDYEAEPSYNLSDGIAPPPKNALSLTLSPSAKYVLAGTDGAGIMRRKSEKSTIFELLTWSGANAGLTSMKVPALATINGRIFAGTAGSGIAVSTNEGESWAPVGGGLPSDLQVFALSACDHTIFAGTNQGIWRSIDNGKNWSQMNQGLPAGIQVDAVVARGGNVFAGAAGSGVFYSNDAGGAWQAFNDGLTNKDVLSLSLNNTDLFAGVKGGGVFVTPIFPNSNRQPVADSQEVIIDEGATKSITLTGSDPDGDPLTYSVVGNPVFNTVTFLRGTTPNLTLTAIQYQENVSFAFRTFDGKSRSRIGIVNIKIKAKSTSTSPPEPPLRLIVEGPSSQFVDAQVRLHVAASGQDVKITANTLPNGATFDYDVQDSMNSATVKWTPATAGTFNFTFAATNSRGDKVTRDFPLTAIANPETGEWTQLNLPENRQVIKLLVDGSTIYAATRANDAIYSDSFDAFFRSTNNGQSWTRIGKGLPANNPILGRLINSGKALYATIGGGLYRSTDTGENWSNIGVGKGLPGDGKTIFNLAASGDKVLAGSSEKIFLSLDGGETWKEITNDLPVKPINNSVQALGISGDVLLASLSLPILDAGPVAYRSIDNGANWLSSNWVTPQAMAQFLVNQDGLYGMTMLGFFQSPDQGVSWQGLNPFFSPSRPNIKFNTSVAAGSGILLVVYQDSGVFISRDRGQNWYPVNQGLTESYSYNVALNSARSFVVTDTGKLFSRPHK